MIYQLIHTLEGFLCAPPVSGTESILNRPKYEDHCPKDAAKKLRERFAHLVDQGIEGIVINVGWTDYLENKKSFNLLKLGFEIALELGLKIMIYDEEGYPSGTAGGKVVKSNPELSAKAIKHIINTDGGHKFLERGNVEILKAGGDSFVIDGDNKGIKDGSEDIYYIADIYEGTHATCNFRESRRYINILDSRANRAFIEFTHKTYKKNLPEHLWNEIQSFFTDEPSFMTAHIPYMLEAKVNPEDPINKDMPFYPCLPYSDELKNYYENKMGEKISDKVNELFARSEQPSESKCGFWQCVQDVYENAYGRTMLQGLEALGTKLSGHILFEDNPFYNMLFHSNPFVALKHFHIPGIDLLSSDVEYILKQHLFSHKMVGSVCWLYDKPMVTETSDYIELNVTRKASVSAKEMLVTLSLQYLFGVREYAYYYDETLMEDGCFTYVNSILKRILKYGEGKKSRPDFSLYCPYETIWAHYQPSDIPVIGFRFDDEDPILYSQPEALINANNDILKIASELFSNNVQYVVCENTSVDNLVSKGVKDVILPRCTVIAKSLYDAALSGRLKLYGGIPQYVFDGRELLPADNLNVIKEIPEKKQAIKAETEVYFCTFEDSYFVINSSLKSARKVNVDGSFIVYDPVTDKEYQANDFVIVEAGNSIFISFI